MSPASRMAASMSLVILSSASDSLVDKVRVLVGERSTTEGDSLSLEDASRWSGWVGCRAAAEVAAAVSQRLESLSGCGASEGTVVREGARVMWQQTVASPSSRAKEGYSKRRGGGGGLAGLDVLPSPLPDPDLRRVECVGGPERVDESAHLAVVVAASATAAIAAEM